MFLLSKNKNFHQKKIIEKYIYLVEEKKVSKEKPPRKKKH